MDGNGRWARAHGDERISGHKAGAKTVRDIVTYSRELGIRYLTLYAFSSENWGRPSNEVDGLMALLSEYLVEERTTLLDNDIELCTIGQTSQLPLSVRTLLRAVKAATKGLKGMRLTLALSYGSRDEIVEAVKSIALDVKSGKLKAKNIDATTISNALDTKGIPDPDLLIRTSGESRISNFMLWQLAYTELYFAPCPWPEFSRAEMDKALESFGGRERRFGLTSAQIDGSENA